LSSSLAERIYRFRAGPDGEAATGDDVAFETVADIVKRMDDAGVLSRDETRELRHAVNAGLLSVRSDNFRGYTAGELDNSEERIHITFVFNRNGVIRLWQER
jgi:hypothetical protein